MCQKALKSVSFSTQILLLLVTATTHLKAPDTVRPLHWCCWPRPWYFNTYIICHAWMTSIYYHTCHCGIWAEAWYAVTCPDQLRDNFLQAFQPFLSPFIRSLERATSKLIVLNFLLGILWLTFENGLSAVLFEQPTRPQHRKMISINGREHWNKATSDPNLQWEFKKNLSEGQKCLELLFLIIFPALIRTKNKC